MIIDYYALMNSSFNNLMIHSKENLIFVYLKENSLNWLRHRHTRVVCDLFSALIVAEKKRFPHTNENNITQCVRRWNSAVLCVHENVFEEIPKRSFSWPSTAPADSLSCRCFKLLYMIHGDFTNSSSFLKHVFSSRDLHTHQRRLWENIFIGR